MHHATIDLAPAAAATGSARYDIYAEIHKALRAFMCDTLVRLGSLDPRDMLEAASVLGQTRELLGLCRAHLEHEDRFVHPAMEARCPGSSAGTGEDHVGHDESIRALESALEAASGAGPGRAAALRGLYRDLARFVGENLEHMAEEERANNAVLWEHYSDAELVAIERELVASVGPEEMRLVLSWMLPALNPAERAGKLSSIRAVVPEPAYRQVLGLAQARLPERAWRRLEQDLR
jgi:hypothetical protein